MRLLSCHFLRTCTPFDKRIFFTVIITNNFFEIEVLYKQPDWRLTQVPGYS